MKQFLLDSLIPKKLRNFYTIINENKVDNDCAFCGSDRKRVLIQNDLFNMGLTTVRCEDCGLVYTNPRPPREVYRNFYDQYYYDFYGFQDIEVYIEKNQILDQARIRLNMYKEYLRDGQSILDVGSGVAAFLSQILLRYKNVKVSAIEPDSRYAEHAAKKFKIDTRVGMFERGVFENQSFDIVCLFHVYEHVLDPIDFMKTIYDVLKSGGYLLLEVPNLNGDWNNISFIHFAHPFIYSIQSLTNILNSLGFDIVRVDQDSEQLKKNSALMVVAQKKGNMRKGIENSFNEKLSTKFKFIESSSFLTVLKKMIKLNIISLKK